MEAMLLVGNYGKGHTCFKSFIHSSHSSFGLVTKEGVLRHNTGMGLEYDATNNIKAVKHFLLSH